MTDTTAPPKKPITIRKIGSIDLNYKHIKAITFFQTYYKYRRQNISKLNKKLGIIYSTLVSVMNRLCLNYQNDILTQERYTELMGQIDSVLSTYEELPSPITLSSYRESTYDKINVTTNYLEYKTVELVKQCGANDCYDILRIIMNDDWQIGVRPSFIRLMKFYNGMFVPTSAKNTSISDGQETPTLPEVKRLNVYTNSIILKIYGAELVIPVCGKIIVIKGYFHNDPLNMARVGGTLGEKLEELKTAQLTEDGDPPDLFRLRYIEQISLRDFVSLDNPQLIRTLRDAYKEVLMIKEKPMSFIVSEFSKAKPEKQSRLLTLLLLDDSTHAHARAVISMTTADSPELLDNIYKYLHLSVQKIFDEVSKSIDKQTEQKIVNEDEIPYETRIENMKCSESIKARAKDKLKEIRNARDGNDKATKYLDSLLKIPFGVYKKERMLTSLKSFKNKLRELVEQCKSIDTISTCELLNDLKQVEQIQTANHIEMCLGLLDKHSEIYEQLLSKNDSTAEMELKPLICEFASLRTKWIKYKEERREYMNRVVTKLDCIYGQTRAKEKLKELIGQWINGEMEGALFGFHGPPGTGKTSLAREGLACCLTDDD